MMTLLDYLWRSGDIRWVMAYAMLPVGVVGAGVSAILTLRLRSGYMLLAFAASAGAAIAGLLAGV
jgi:hypothetical protein